MRRSLLLTTCSCFITLTQCRYSYRTHTPTCICYDIRDQVSTWNLYEISKSLEISDQQISMKVYVSSTTIPFFRKKFQWQILKRRKIRCGKNENWSRGVESIVRSLTTLPRSSNSLLGGVWFYSYNNNRNPNQKLTVSSQCFNSPNISV